MYVLEILNGPGAMTTELDRRLRVLDIVMRHLIIRIDEVLAKETRTQTRRKAANASSPRPTRPSALPSSK